MKASDEPADEGLKLLKGPQLSRGKKTFLLDFPTRLPQRHIPACGKFGEPIQGPPADPSRWNVHHTEKTHRVGRVGNQPKICQKVSNLLALVEPEAAHDRVWDDGAPQGILQNSGLSVHTIEDGEVVKAISLSRREVPYGLDDEGCLIRLVSRLTESDRLPLFVFRPEPLFLPAPVPRDDGKGRL